MSDSLAKILENEEGASLWNDAWRRLRQNRMAMGSVIFFAGMVLLCVLGPFAFSGADSSVNNLEANFQPPSSQFWFGTDDLGRDVFKRTIEGGRISLAVGFLATAVSLIIGVVYGSIAGYLGGRVDAFLMRVVDILYSLPFVIFVILLMVMSSGFTEWIHTNYIANLSEGWWSDLVNKVFEEQTFNLLLMFVAIGAVEWLTMARIVRAQVMALKNTEFVEAARALGFGNVRIIFAHLLPNVLGPVIIYSSLTVPAVMLLEAVLSFLGLGVQPPMSSWGLLIKDGAEKIDVYPWLLIFPALFFSATLFSLNFIGDGLRDALDPKSSKD